MKPGTKGIGWSTIVGIMLIGFKTEGINLPSFIIEEWSEARNGDVEEAGTLLGLSRYFQTLPFTKHSRSPAALYLSSVPMAQSWSPTLCFNPVTLPGMQKAPQFLAGLVPRPIGHGKETKKVGMKNMIRLPEGYRQRQSFGYHLIQSESVFRSGINFYRGDTRYRR